MKPLHPIVSEGSRQFFSDYTQPEDIQEEGYEGLQTNYLKPGELFSLIGISQTESLLQRGVLEATDNIDPLIKLEEIALRVTRGNLTEIVYLHSIGREPLSTFTCQGKGDYRMMDLECPVSRGLEHSDGGIYVVDLLALGDVNLQTGDTRMVFTAPTFPIEFADRVAVVGYKLSVNRTSSSNITA